MPHETLLNKYLQLPDRLEAAIAGLDEAGLNLKTDGWSIRQYVHSVRDIVLIHIGHMDQHTADIQRIREHHKK
jgi:hypothetical protein